MKVKKGDLRLYISLISAIYFLKVYVDKRLEGKYQKINNDSFWMMG